MDLQAEKIEVVKLLLDSNDSKVISTIKALLQNTTDMPPPHVIAEIKIAQEQVKKGLFTPHEEVMKKYAKYL
jgi:uncharacterized pyridoxal phosphate-containing UPF0001 family protein